MTEDEVEHRVEKMTNALDRQLMRGVIDQTTYDSAIADLARWADVNITGRR